MSFVTYDNAAGAAVIDLEARDGSGITTIRAKSYCERFETGKVKSKTGMRSGYTWRWTNWNVLTDAEKTEAGAWVWEFDEEINDWLPMTRLYMGG